MRLGAVAAAAFVLGGVAGALAVTSALVGAGLWIDAVAARRQRALTGGRR